MSDKTEGWRDLSDDPRSDFLTWVGSSMSERQQFGRDAYGDTFEGDPLDHLIEELLDALFYAWVAKRRDNA